MYCNVYVTCMIVLTCDTRHTETPVVNESGDECLILMDVELLTYDFTSQHALMMLVARFKLMLATQGMMQE